MKQITSQILMIRPAAFQYNIETATSNDFQQDIKTLSAQEIVIKAQEEFDTMVQQLREKDIMIEVIQDTISPIKPDAIFPNNWISMNQDNTITIFPMKTPNRRLEKRKDIIELIQNNFIVERLIELSHFELEDRALEGTGSIVYDHIHRIAYACVSPRTDIAILTSYCSQIGYSPIWFHAYDAMGGLIYHTNVMMCIGEGFVAIGLDTIKDEKELDKLKSSFIQSNLEIICLSNEQIFNNFAGNMIQLSNKANQKYLVLSQRAYTSLDQTQHTTFHKYTEILPVSIDIIEQIGGGSARCMIAEIFLSKK